MNAYKQRESIVDLLYPYVYIYTCKYICIYKHILVLINNLTILQALQALIFSACPLIYGIDFR